MPRVSQRRSPIALPGSSRRGCVVERPLAERVADFAFEGAQIHARYSAQSHWSAHGSRAGPAAPPGHDDQPQSPRSISVRRILRDVTCAALTPIGARTWMMPSRIPCASARQLVRGPRRLALDGRRLVDGRPTCVPPTRRVTRVIATTSRLHISFDSRRICDVPTRGRRTAATEPAGCRMVRSCRERGSGNRLQ
jgi:hypothetical protein